MLLLWHWRRLWGVFWTARRSNQSILKQISPEYSLEGLMLKPKLQYFDHMIWRTKLFEKTMMLKRLKVGGKGYDRGWDGWMASLMSDLMDMSLSKLQELVRGKEAWQAAVCGWQKVGHDWATELNWTELKGFPGGTTGKEHSCQYRRCKRCRFDPWVRKIPSRRHGNSVCYSYLENPHGQCLAAYSP